MILSEFNEMKCRRKVNSQFFSDALVPSDPANIFICRNVSEQMRTFEQKHCLHNIKLFLNIVYFVCVNY